jgi:phosphate:Na+ symporter
MIFSDIVSGLERVADHATNIAFAIKEEEDNLNAARQGALPHNNN